MILRDRDITEKGPEKNVRVHKSGGAWTLLAFVQKAGEMLCVSTNVVTVELELHCSRGDLLLILSAAW